MHFTGKMLNAEFNLDASFASRMGWRDDFDARYYSSQWGRFMIPDWDAKPAAVPYAKYGDPQSLNLYAYVRNNPSTTRDPDGHCGAPSGLQPGSVGICVASFIAAPHIGHIGYGEDRGPSGHGGTSRIETRLVVNPKDGTVTQKSDTVGKSQVLVKSFGLQGSGKSTVSNVSEDKQGTTHFQVSQDAHSSYALGGLVFGSIDNHLNLDVTNDQKVGVEAGSSAKGYPSLEVYACTMDAKGKITEKLVFFKQESGNSSDLKGSEQPIKPQNPQ